MSKSKAYINQKGEQVDVTIYVTTRPNLRGSADEMFMYQGKTILDNIFDIKKIDKKTTTTHLQYPERWSNILEQRVLINLILKYYPNIQKVTVLTHSVYIIQCTERNHCLIYNDNPDQKYNEGKGNEVFAPPPDEMEGLMVLGGSVKVKY